MKKDVEPAHPADGFQPPLISTLGREIIMRYITFLCLFVGIFAFGAGCSSIHTDAKPDGSNVQIPVGTLLETDSAGKAAEAARLASVIPGFAVAGGFSSPPFA